MENNIKVMVNPYNFNNKTIDKSLIESILLEYGINDKIFSHELYQQAFVHNSYTEKKPEEIGENIIIADKPEGAINLFKDDYERLEFLGDAVISNIVAKYLYERYPSQDEGFLTKMRTKLVNGEMLAFLSKNLGFGEYAIISRHIEDKCNGRKAIHILEDMFEAFIGAMFLDFNEKDNYNLLDKYYSGIGYQICEKFMINVYETHLDFSELVMKNTNYKEQLNRYFQETYGCQIIFSEPTIDGGLSDKIYYVNILDKNGNTIGKGLGKSKKKLNRMPVKTP